MLSQTSSTLSDPPIHPPRPAATAAARPSDQEELIERLQAGDEASYEILVRRYGGRMLSVARRLLRSEDRARDAVQEAFISAFRSIGRFRRGCRLETWLHRITVNAALMRMRAEKRRSDVSLDTLLPFFHSDGRHAGPLPVLPADTLDNLLREETRRGVRRAIAKLPESSRTVVLLRDIEELSTAEVADLLGITANAVKIRLHRARMALVRLVSDELVETTGRRPASKIPCEAETRQHPSSDNPTEP